MVCVMFVSRCENSYFVFIHYATILPIINEQYLENCIVYYALATYADMYESAHRAYDIYLGSQNFKAKNVDRTA